MPPILRPAVFFDRDGVLNHDDGFVSQPSQIRWVDGAFEAVRACNVANYLVFVVTNQSGIARGYYTEAQMHALHDWMRAQFAAAGARVDAFAHCPHLPPHLAAVPPAVAENGRSAGAQPHLIMECACRKPKPGMITGLLAAWPVDVARSFMVGDRESDMQAAAAAGLRGVVFTGGNLLTVVAPLLP